MRTLFVPVVRISDMGGKPRRVGSDSHDVLRIDSETGGIQYSNLHNGEGTGAPQDELDFAFSGQFGGCFKNEIVEFKDIGDFLLEIKDEIGIKNYPQKEEIYDEALEKILKIITEMRIETEKQREFLVRESMERYFKDEEVEDNENE